MKIKNNKTTISKMIIFILFLFTIITLSFSNIKGQESNIYVNKDSNITNPDGTYNNPFKTLEDAISHAGNNATIMIQTDFSIDESNLNINKDLIIMSSDKTITGEQNNKKFELNTKFGRIIVEPGNSLTLQNIIINGNASNETPNTKQAIQVGKIDSDEISKLIINDETLIKNTHRANNGGSAIVLSNAKLYMNGGEISNNFNNTGYAIIGIDTGRENHSSIYLTGGNIINNNISGSVIATHNGLKELIIGGNININNNQNGLSIPINGVKVKDDLTGEVVFNVDSGDLYNNTINMTVEGTNKNFYNISPLNNPNLYAIHKGNGEYVWDYKYNEVPSLINTPSFDIGGSYGNKSIGGDIYINIKNLPVLNAEDYNILEDNGNFIFEYKEETEIKIEVTYEDYLNHLKEKAISEFEEYANVLDGSYENVINDLKQSIQDTKNVYEVDSNLESAKDALVENVKNKLKDDILTDYNKKDYSEENYQKILDRIDETFNNLENLSGVLEFDYDNSELKNDLMAIPTILDEAKQDALNQLKDAYESYEENDYSNDNWSELKSAYEGAKVAIEQSTSTEEINDNLNNGIEEMSNVPTLLDETKQDALNQLKDAYESYEENDYSEENWSVLTDAYTSSKEAIEESSTVEDVNINLNIGIEEMSNVPTLEEELSDAKDSLKNEILKDYDEVDYSEDNYQKIVDKIDDALKELDNVDEVNNFDDSNLKDELDKVPTILDENNEKLINKLNEIYNSYRNSGMYSDEGLNELENIYNDLFEKIQNVEYNDVPTLEKDAKNLFDQVEVIKSEEHDMNDPEIKYEDSNPDEYYSNVSNSEGMKKGYKVIVTNVEVVVNKKDKVLDYIKRDKTVILDELINNKDIKNKTLFAQLEISLVDSDGNKVDSIEYKGTYEVSFLLPEKFINRENIKVVYLSDDLVEVFKTEVNDLGWVTFETTHFSNFFLISDPLEGELETINLWWLIIIMLVIIVLEVITIVWKRTKNNEERTYSLVLPVLAVILPSNAYIIILILGIIIVLLLAYIIYLFLFIEQDEIAEEELLIDEEEPLIEVKDELIIEDNKIDDVKQEEKLELNKKTEVSTKDKVVPPVITPKRKPRTLYNYSFTARLHLADIKTLERFNEIKNYVLSYEGVRVSKSWSQETYLLNNESIFKVRVNGKTMNLFFNLDPGSFNDTKYVLIDRSNVKVHEKTPAQYQVNGPRKLEWAKELVDIYMKDKNSKKKSDYIDKDFKVEPKTMEQLIEEDLIKVTEINAEYEDIIFND